MRPSRRSYWSALVVATAISISCLVSSSSTAWAAPTPTPSPSPTVSKAQKESIAKKILETSCSVAGGPLVAICIDVGTEVLVEGKDPTAVANEKCSKAPPKLISSCKFAVPKIVEGAQFVFGPQIAALQEASATADDVNQTVDCAKEPFNCFMEGVQREAKKLVEFLLTSYVDTLTQPSGVYFGSPDFLSVVNSVGELSALVAMLFLLLSFARATFLMAPREAVRGIAGLAQWGLMLVGGLTAAQLILNTSDGIAGWLTASNGESVDQVADRFSSLWTEVATGTVQESDGSWTWIPNGASPGIANTPMILLLLLIGLATLLSLAWMLFRNVGVLLIAVSMPILASGLIGPEATRKWLWRGLQAFISLALAKPIMVLALNLGLSRLGESRDIVRLIEGALILLAAAFAPPVVYKLIGIMNFSGSGSVSGRATMTTDIARSTSDMAMRIMRHNAPASAPSVSSSATGPAVRGSGTGSLAGSSLAGPVGLAAGGVLAATAATKGAAAWALNSIGSGSGALSDNQGSNGASLHPSRGLPLGPSSNPRTPPPPAQPRQLPGPAATPSSAPALPPAPPPASTQNLPRNQQ